MVDFNFAPDRVYGQYRTDAPTVSWYNIVPTLGDEICTAYEAIRKMYDIDANVGEQLNIIGRLVVVDRGFESELNWDSLQWGSPEAVWGGLNVQWESSDSIVSSTVSDAIFRIIIKAKIAKNNSESTLDGVVTALSYITNTVGIKVIDNENMTFSVSFGQPLDSITRFVLSTFDIVPRPQGVGFLGFTEEAAITQWGGQLNWGDSQAQYGQFFGA